MRRTATAALIFFSALLLFSSSALAQMTGNPHPLQVKLMFGFGGEAELDVEGGTSVEDDMIPTVGFGAEYDFSVYRDVIDFSIGPLVAFLWWNSDAIDDADFGRSLGIDLDVVPKVTYQATDAWYVYGALPIGLTISVLNEDAVVGDPNAGFGWNLALWGGLQYDLGRVGIFAEIGFHLHKFTNSTDIGAIEVDGDVRLLQFAFNVGVAFL